MSPPKDGVTVVTVMGITVHALTTTIRIIIMAANMETVPENMAETIIRVPVTVATKTIIHALAITAETITTTRGRVITAEITTHVPDMEAATITTHVRISVITNRTTDIINRLPVTTTVPFPRVRPTVPTAPTGSGTIIRHHQWRSAPITTSRHCRL